MRLTSTGLGIGTASPSAVFRLDVNGNTRVSSAGAQGLEVQPGALTYLLAYNRGASAYIPLDIAGEYVRFSTNSGTERMRIDASGNLGIGTSSPGDKLTVAGNIGLANNGTSLQWTSAGNNVALNAASGVLDFYTGTSAYNKRLTIDSSGNLGLGVTPSAWGTTKALEFSYGSFSANSSLGTDVAGNCYYNGTNWIYRVTGVALRYNQATAGHSWHVASGTAGNAITFTQAMTLDASGNLLLGITAVSDTPAHGVVIRDVSGTSGAVNVGHASGVVTGTAYMNFAYNGGGIGSITQNGTTGVLYNIMSDARLKTVKGAVSGHGERIDALLPVEYEWKADGAKARGFLAHQFQEVYPSSVTGSKDAVDSEGKPVYQAMQPSTAEVIADLVAELQSLRARLAVLEAK